MADKHGPEKTVTQCKNKIRNLKAAYKAAKENNKKIGASPKFCQYFNDFNKVLGTRDVMHQHCETESKFISNIHVPVSACIVIRFFRTSCFWSLV